MQQSPQQLEDWDFQAQDNSRQEVQAWRAKEVSYTKEDPRQRQSGADLFAQQHYRQPSAYALDRNLAFQDPHCGQPTGQLYGTPPYSAMRADHMHAHGSAYVQRVLATCETPVLRDSSLISQEAQYHRAGQQPVIPLQSQIYRGFGREYDEPLMNAQQYTDPPCASGGPVVQAPQHLHQMTAHDYPPRARQNMPVRVMPNYLQRLC